jgi:hypothetical protein
MINQPKKLSILKYNIDLLKDINEQITPMVDNVIAIEIIIAIDFS